MNRRLASWAACFYQGTSTERSGFFWLARLRCRESKPGSHLLLQFAFGGKKIFQNCGAGERNSTGTREPS